MTGDGGPKTSLVIAAGLLIIKRDDSITTFVQDEKPVSNWRRHRYSSSSKHFLS